VLVSIAGFASWSVADDRQPIGVEFDLQACIDAQFRAGKQCAVVPPGRYRVRPQHGRHLFFKGLADKSIVADGVEMICTQTVRAVGFEDCRNVQLKGLVIDYDPLPIAEARITATAPDKSWLEFEIILGYPDDTLFERIEIYDPATRELRRTDAPWTKEFQSLGDHRYRATKRKGYRYDAQVDTEQVGDILVTINQYPARAGGHAIQSERCVNLKLEDITVYASPMFGFVEHECDATTYLRCKIDRRAPSDDPVQRGFPRMRSLSADAFHSVGAVRGPAILSCTAKFQGDDCVNIHGFYDMVLASRGRELRVASVSRTPIQPGEPLEFLPREGKRPPDAVAKALVPDGPLTAEERKFLEKLSLYPRHKERLLADQARLFRLTVDREVPLAMGSAVCSGNRVGNGFAVKDCDFGYNRSRGILIKASRGEVTGNTITHGWMAAVLVAPEFWWLESASSSDVLVANNKIIGCRRPAIEVAALGGNGKPLPSGAHRQITIQGNTITDSVWPNIYVTSTDGLVIRGNRLTPADPSQMTPPLARRWDWRQDPPQPIVTLFCDRPQIAP
jgi:hypothetical protein